MMIAKTTMIYPTAPAEYSSIFLWPAIESVMSNNGINIENCALAETDWEIRDLTDFRFVRDDRVKIQESMPASVVNDSWSSDSDSSIM